MSLVATLKVIIFVALIAVSVYYVRLYMKGSTCQLVDKVSGKVVLITGANTGIGFETAVELAKRGGIIHMACRNDIRCLAAREEVLKRSEVDPSKVQTHILDLASFSSILKFVKQFKDKTEHLDILINNAGVMMTPFMMTEDGFEMQMGVNHLGHFLLTNELLDLIKLTPDSRIIILSSRAHQRGLLDPNNLVMSEGNYDKFSAYAQSKLANVLHAKVLAKRLSGHNIAVVSVHPGAVDTELSRHLSHFLKPIIFISRYFLLKSPIEGAQTTICCAVDPNILRYSGSYFSDCKPIESPNLAVYNDTLAEQLWDQSTIIVEETLKSINKNV